MKLISYGPAGEERPGVLLGDETILDLRLASGDEIKTIRQLLEHGDVWLERITGWIAKGPEENWLRSSQGERFGPPVTNPSNRVSLTMGRKAELSSLVQTCLPATDPQKICH